MLTKLLEHGARVIVTAHLGRPKGAPEDKHSLRPVADRLAQLLGQPVDFALDTVGESARILAQELEDGEILLLKYTEDWSYRQLAAHLGISESAVEARLHRARQRLRSELAALEVIETRP